MCVLERSGEHAEMAGPVALEVSFAFPVQEHVVGETNTLCVTPGGGAVA